MQVSRTSVYIWTSASDWEHFDSVVRKLNKPCGLIHRVRGLFLRKWLLLFFNSFFKSVISCGLLAWGSAAETNFHKVRLLTDELHERYSSFIYSIIDILVEHRILTAYELYMVVENCQRSFQTTPNRCTHKILWNCNYDKNKPIYAMLSKWPLLFDSRQNVYNKEISRNSAP